jgi:hypothetical protein
MMDDAQHELREQCDWERATASYVDGELGETSAAIFEAHAKECSVCSRVVREQRRLLCLLDIAFDDSFEREVQLPADFTRVVKARAQTDMSGVRSGRERSIAIKICLALGIAVFALLGLSAFDALRPLADATSAAASVIGVSVRALTDAGVGALVVARALGGRLISDSGALAFLQWILFGCALALLLLMIGRYHRAGLTD